MSTPLNSTSNQPQDSDICVTGTPRLSGTRTVALSLSDQSSLKITVIFSGDSNRKLPCEVSGSEQQIKSPRDKAVTKDTEDVDEEYGMQERVSEVEKQIASPRSKSSCKDHDAVAAVNAEQENTSSRQSERTSEKSNPCNENGENLANKLDNNHQQADGSVSNHKTGSSKVTNAEKMVTAKKTTTTLCKRDSSSVSDMEINRGSMTESPSVNIFPSRVNNLSMTPLSELEQEAKATQDNDKGKNSSLLVSDIGTDESIGNESEISECSYSRRGGSTQTSVIESGAEDRISSANTSHNRSSLRDSKHNLSTTNANNNTSQCLTPKEEGKTVARVLPQQLQRILDEHDQNSSFNQSLSELDSMEADVEATSTPAAGKSKTMKVVNTLRLVTVMIPSFLFT